MSSKLSEYLRNWSCVPGTTYVPRGTGSFLTNSTSESLETLLSPSRMPVLSEIPIQLFSVLDVVLFYEIVVLGVAFGVTHLRRDAVQEVHGRAILTSAVVSKALPEPGAVRLRVGREPALARQLTIVCLTCLCAPLHARWKQVPQVPAHCSPGFQSVVRCGQCTPRYSKL